MTKVIWKGEDGGPSSITMQHPVTGQSFVFKAGKAVDVPADMAGGALLGNPFFDIVGPTEKDDPKAAEIRRLEDDVAAAKVDLDTAPDDHKADARKRLDAAQTKLDAARK